MKPKIYLFIQISETIFPPVFGHRLQAKVAKCGERVIMDIEVSGIPLPIVTFFKDDRPLHESNVSTHKITSSGNCHTLIIEKGNPMLQTHKCTAFFSM